MNNSDICWAIHSYINSTIHSYINSTIDSVVDSPSANVYLVNDCRRINSIVFLNVGLAVSSSIRSVIYE